MPEDTPKKRGDSLGSDPEFLTAFRPERRPPPKKLSPLTEGERKALKELARRMKED